MIEINVKDPWFTFIKNGCKKIEGRLNKGKFALLKKGEIIKFNNNNNYVTCRIIKIKKYISFKEYLSQEGLKRTLPGIKTIEDGVNEYYKFYNEEDEYKYNILAIYIKRLKD
jgi:ASC-1-like (ASCH) protein